MAFTRSKIENNKHNYLLFVSVDALDRLTVNIIKLKVCS